MRLRHAAGLAALASALLPYAATAAEVSLDYEPALPGIEPDAAYTLTVRDRAKEHNRLAIGGGSGGYTVRDENAAVTAGPGCVPVAFNEVHCATPNRAPDRSIFIGAGAGWDVVGVANLSPGPKIELHGGPGNDLLAGGPARDLMAGGSGNDWLAGGSGDDRLDGGRGNDRLEGGPGTDAASYQRRRRGVHVDLAVGLGGQRGELDTLAGIEDVTGGRGPDRLSGNRRSNVLLGGTGPGRDVVAGRGGNDALLGHRALGGAGSDRIDAPRYSCGRGGDFVMRSVHRVRGPFPLACEAILADFVYMRPDPVRRSRRRVVFAIKCPFADIRCGARLELRDRRGRLGKGRFRFLAPPEGPYRRVVMRLDRRPAGRVGTLRLRGRKVFDRDWFRTRLRR